MTDTTIIDALISIVGDFPSEYDFILYAAVIIMLIMFCQWIFGTISRLIFSIVDRPRRR